MARLRLEIFLGVRCAGRLRAGSIVTPRAMPRGMIVTLWSGSECSRMNEDQRVPGLVIGGNPLLLVGQQHGLALGTHQHLVLRQFEVVHDDLTCDCTRAALSAASLTMLARSAPEKPGVPRARMLRLTSSATGTFFDVNAEDLFAATDVGTVPRRRGGRSGRDAEARDRERRDGWWQRPG